MSRTALIGGLAALLAASAALAQAPAPSAAPEAPAAGAAAPAPQPIPPAAFRSPEEGFAALVAALRAPGDRQALRVLGSAGSRLIRSGDAVEDRAVRQRFLAAYDQKAEIVRPAPGRAVLEVGSDGWPLPLPMLERGGVWRFDSVAAGQELVDRRIGRNELDTIEVMRELVDAQADYASGVGREGAFRVYARRFFSTPGRRNGLYWQTGPDEAPSPLGPLFAAASAGGYSRTPGDTPQPFHGYLFRMLEAQGPAAPGGAMDYLVNGRMIGGFAAIAWPAQYGVSGIKTFMVSHSGDVWERDLGPNTARVVAGTTRFDPGEGWTRVPE